MAVPKSQSYTVDNRYQQAKEVSDNREGLGFLRNYLQARKAAGRFPVTQERRGDDRFVFAGQGGTVPVSALPYSPRGAASIGNTDGRIGFRNSFRATPS
jgi:hypothetical protein